MSQTVHKPIVDVAVGVLLRADGRVLLAERPIDKLSGGHWEFPGGKFEIGEVEVQALKREVYEEVGVEVDAAHPWLVYTHEYEDKIVRLHVYKVLAWHGTPRGEEKQRISWEDPAVLSVAPFMEAHQPALDALSLPSVVATAEADGRGMSETLTRLETSLGQGLQVVVLSERNMVSSQFAQFARRVVDRARRYGAKVLVQGNTETALRASADGIHVSAEYLRRMNVAPPFAVWSASCRDSADLDKAASLGAAFATVPPTAAGDGAGFDWPEFQELIRASAIPVFAAGDMARADLDAAVRSGAHGIAVNATSW